MAIGLEVRGSHSCSVTLAGGVRGEWPPSPAAIDRARTRRQEAPL
jgi:hypothetical protein